MTQVEITLNQSNVVLAINNNTETPNFKKAKISVGDKIESEFFALMLMNPHRFKIIR